MDAMGEHTNHLKGTTVFVMVAIIMKNYVLQWMKSWRLPKVALTEVIEIEKSMKNWNYYVLCIYCRFDLLHRSVIIFFTCVTTKRCSYHFSQGIDHFNRSGVKLLTVLTTRRCSYDIFVRNRCLFSYTLCRRSHHKMSCVVGDVCSDTRSVETFMSFQLYFV